MTIDVRTIAGRVLYLRLARGAKFGLIVLFHGGMMGAGPKALLGLA